MRKSSIAAALACALACSGANALTLLGDHFSVELPNAWFAPVLNAGTLVLDTDDGIITDHFQRQVTLASGLNLDWIADTGFSITGFTVKYNLAFGGGTLGEWKGTGSFAAGTGSAVSWVYGDAPAASAVDEVQGDLSLILYSLTANGLIEGECAPPTDFGKCGSPQTWVGPIVSTARLTSIEITPHVSAVPEPETYALMLLGLAGVAAATRKRIS